MGSKLSVPLDGSSATESGREPVRLAGGELAIQTQLCAAHSDSLAFADGAPIAAATKKVRPKPQAIFFL